jgi:hypothetical protein
MPLISVFRALLAMAAAFVTVSCAGYHLGSDRPAVMEGVRTLAVPVFRNDSSIPRSSVLITNRVIRQLQIDGSYRIVDTSQADAILRGTIRPVRRTQLRSEKLNTLRTLEQEVRLVLDYSVETRSGAVLTTGSVEGSTSVFLDVNFQRSEYQALDDAAAHLAEDLVSRLAEGWGSADLPPPAAAVAKPSTSHHSRPSFLNR